ncbi:hypothetical protein [Lewinella sp. W8]|uniref:hypothetical protein n=1 Tax=Lewinella sp. W8 TaxID=2528208 RepID=UPI0010674E57|nr:hypothetical protein [Lewinella sp. W8]MTB50250.1 hypothetical protein [Lewinella sp. W8]
MRIIQSIREYVAEDNIDEAFSAIFSGGDLPADMQDDFLLLSNQYRAEEKQFIRGMRRDNVERNRILYGFLTLLSQWEERIAEDKQVVKKAALLARKEHQLMRSYEALGQITKRNPIDIFFDALIEARPSTFHQLLQQEGSPAGNQLFQDILDHTDFEALSRLHPNHRLSGHEWRSIVHNGQQANPYFAKGWLEYHDYRQRYAGKVEEVIRTNKKQWNTILSAGSVGLFIGGVGAALLKDPLSKLLQHYSDGDDPDMIDEEDDDDYGDDES